MEIDADNLEAIKSTSRYFKTDRIPRTEIGSILDDQLLEKLAKDGGFDVVYSWGVLHHTGRMYKAIENAAKLVKPGGILSVAIYRTHWTSPIWLAIKYLYNKGPNWIRRPMVAFFYWVIYFGKLYLTGDNPKKMARGMDFHHDVVDWVGGYPYEYASAEEVISFVGARGFKQVFFKPARIITGCNQFVFEKRKS